MAITLLEKALIEMVVEAVTRSVGSHSDSPYRKQVDSRQSAPSKYDAGAHRTALSGGSATGLGRLCYSFTRSPPIPASIYEGA